MCVEVCGDCRGVDGRMGSMEELQTELAALEVWVDACLGVGA